MDFFQALFNMLAGAVVLLATRPFDGGIVAYLATTFIVFVALPGGVGILLSIIGETPNALRTDVRFEWWFRWCVARPIAWLWRTHWRIQAWLWPRLGRGLAAAGRALWRFVRYGFDGPTPPASPPPATP